MHPYRQQGVFDKQRMSLVRMAERRQQQAPQTRNRDVIDARTGLIAQIANSPRVGVVRDRVQRLTDSQSLALPSGARFQQREMNRPFGD
jgi:hypothetical protein